MQTDRRTDGQTESGHTVSDVYTIQVGGSKLNVWCDMDTGEGGWTVSNTDRQTDRQTESGHTVSDVYIQYRLEEAN